jgi:hypothetical protein
MFVFGKAFQPTLMFVSMVRAYSNRAPFRNSHLSKDPGLAHKHQTRLKTLSRDKLSSYFGLFVRDKEKQTFKALTRGQKVRAFVSVQQMPSLIMYLDQLHPHKH